MRFIEVLTANSIDPGKLVAIQNEFVANYKIGKGGAEKGCLDFFERDKNLTMLEKFINRIEWELLRCKMEQGDPDQQIPIELTEAAFSFTIDSDTFISVQNEFISFYRNGMEEKMKTMNYRRYLELDQLLTSFEKFINRIERDRIKKKITNISI